LDKNLNIREYYEPETQNRNINPRVCYFIYHNQHIYHLNHNLKSLEQKLQDKKGKMVEICSTPNTKYYLKKQEETISDLLFINNANYIIGIINNECVFKNVNLFYDRGNCYDLYFDLIKMGIESSVAIKNGKVSFDMLKMNNIKQKNITIFTHEEEGVTLHKEFGNNKIYQHYIQKRNWALNNLLNKQFISHYSSNVKQMLDAYKSGLIIGSFVETE